MSIEIIDYYYWNDIIVNKKIYWVIIIVFINYYLYFEQEILDLNELCKIKIQFKVLLNWYVISMLWFSILILLITTNVHKNYVQMHMFLQYFIDLK